MTLGALRYRLNHKRVRLIIGIGVALFGVLSIIGAIHQITTSSQTRELQRYGIATSAHVLKSSYDPEGGDPNGWTTDTVEFRRSNGKTQQAVIGHHGEDIERISGVIKIVYDPDQPDVVMSAAQMKDASPNADLAVAIIFITLNILAALWLLFYALHISKKHV